MADPALPSLFNFWNKLQDELSSAPSSSRPCVTPNLTKLNDMVYEVHRPPPEQSPDLEIVFFHGLTLTGSNDSYFTTWLSQDNSEMWLQTWLVQSFPNARIMTIAYDSSAKRTRDSGRLDMHCTGENLLICLTGDEVRVGQSRCPVVLVGHCLGGLVLKELCVSAAWTLSQWHAAKPKMQRIENLLLNLKGMFFYGTPHTGSILGDMMHQEFKGALLEETETLKASTARRNQAFTNLKNKHGWETYGLGESMETYVECIGKCIHVVPEASARAGMDGFYLIPKDHFNICKPEGTKDNSFQKLKDFLKSIQSEGVTVHDTSIREYYIDQEERVSSVRSILELPETNTIFIVGPNGIGKTALAEQVFHTIGDNYTFTCFLYLDNIEAPADVKEDVLRQIQKKLKGSGRDSDLSSMLSHLKRNKVLMVLDNVESQDQLDALRTASWLQNNSSKLIVTTRHSWFGTSSNTYQIRYLDSSESKEMFNHYAFNGRGAPENLREIIQQVVEKCDGFPLALKVLGGYVSKGDINDKEVWLELLNKLENVQEVDSNHDFQLWSKLRLCYDTLLSSDQEVFLDIATIFHGFPLSLAKIIWSSCRATPRLAWRNLERRCLVSVGEDGSIQMHGELRKLGQSIACPSQSSLDKWKRIPNSDFAKKLIEEHQGIVETQALKLQVTGNECLTLSNATFLKYQHLRYLVLQGVKTLSGRMKLPRSLVFLRWTGGSFRDCPDFTGLKELVVLEFIDCAHFQSLSPGIADANKLKWLNLEGCRSLRKLPVGLSRCLEHLGLKRTGVKELPRDLHGLQKLQHLLVNYFRLSYVPQSLGRLGMLVSLDLSDTQVKTLPDCIGDLSSLTYLNLASTMLSSLPEGIGRLQSLKWLVLGNTSLKMIPDSVGNLAKLESLDLNDTPLETLPDTIGKLRSLRHLELKRTQLMTLPSTLGELVQLEILQVSSSRWTEWPESLQKLSNLDDLRLGNGAFPSQSEEVGGGGEESPLDSNSMLQLQSKTDSLPSQLSALHKVWWLTLSGRGYHQAWVQSLFLALQQMPDLMFLQLHDFNLVKTIPSEMKMLTELRSLSIENWDKLQELPAWLGDLCKLESLDLKGLSSLCRFTVSLGAFPVLELLEITECPRLLSITSASGPVSSVERECSTSENRESTPSDSLNASATGRLDVGILWTDSWRIVECFLQCGKFCGKFLAWQIRYYVECKKIEKAWKMVDRRGVSRDVLDIKVALGVFTEMHSHPCQQDNCLHEPVGPSISHSKSHQCYPHELGLWCKKRSCDLHRFQRWQLLVRDVEKESDDEGEDCTGNAECGGTRLIQKSPLCGLSCVLLVLFLFLFSSFKQFILLYSTERTEDRLRPQPGKGVASCILGSD